MSKNVSLGFKFTKRKSLKKHKNISLGFELKKNLETE